MRYLLLTNLEIILIVVIAFLILSITSYFFAGKTLLDVSLKRNNYLGKAIGRKFKRLSKRFKIDYAWWDEFPIEFFNIQSHDGLELYGRILKQKEKTDLVAIVVHGFMNNYKDMQTYCKYFYDRGYNVLAVDNRAHGLSEGGYVGMGWQDRIDLLAWIEHATQKFGKNVKIVLFGLSMGGATVCMASGEDLPENVKCIISDCAFDNVYNQFYHIIKKEFKFPAFSLIKTFETYNRLYFGQSIKEQDTISQVKKSKTPIFIIHGDKDDFVPVDMAYRIYNAIDIKIGKQIYIVPNAWHAESYAKATKQYTKKLDDWIGKYIK